MKSNYKKAIISGVGLGAVNGFFGGGGGMIAVPLLSGALGYTDKQAHATAILVIAPVCLVSAIIYIIGGFTRADVIIPATIGNVTGGLVGAELLGKIPEIWTDLIFIAVLIVAGVKMVI
ncbi:MAG: TSUP family transporter [Candidatus Coproplasma sp.]